MTMVEFNDEVQVRMTKHRDCRTGQAMFLVAWDHVGEKINHILGSDRDPFYNDERIPEFLVYLVDNNFFSDMQRQET
jgi:hypothetical protein